MFDDSYLKSSRQLWKLFLFFLVFSIVGLALIGTTLKGMLGEEVNLLIFIYLFGLGLAVTGFVLAVLTVQCPNCNARLLWKAVREQSHRNWFDWLIGLTGCPVCHQSNRAGSADVQNKARVARSDYRKVLGSELIREVILKNQGDAFYALASHPGSTPNKSIGRERRERVSSVTWGGGLP